MSGGAARRDHVLITRPEPGASETAAAISALGWVPVLAPAMVLAPRPCRAVPRAQAVLLPSRAAARALGALDLPVFAVGEATAAEASARGWRDVAAAEGDAAALVALVARRLDPARGALLLAVGQGYGNELGARLRDSGFRVIRRVVYAAAPVPALPDAARIALAEERCAAAIFLSPRAADVASALIGAAGLASAARGITALALSPRIATVLRALPWRACLVPARPDIALLLGMLGRPGEGPHGP